MAYHAARLLEVLQLGETITGALDLPEATTPAPGRYLPAQRLWDQGEFLSQPLFKIIQSSGHTYLGPIPAHWQPGDRIACFSLRGNGFQLPPSARRVGLLSTDGCMARPFFQRPYLQPEQWLIRVCLSSLAAGYFIQYKCKPCWISAHSRSAPTLPCGGSVHQDYLYNRNTSDRTFLRFNLPPKRQQVFIIIQ